MSSQMPMLSTISSDSNWFIFTAMLSEIHFASGWCAPESQPAKPLHTQSLLICLEKPGLDGRCYLTMQQPNRTANMQGEELPAVPATFAPENSDHAHQSPAAAVPDQATCLSEIIIIPPDPVQGFPQLAATSKSVTANAAFPIMSSSAAAVRSEVAQPSAVGSEFVVPDWMLAGPAALTASALPMCPEPGLAAHQNCPPPSDQIYAPPSDQYCPRPCGQADAPATIPECAHELADTAATPAAGEKAAGSGEGAVGDAAQPNLRPIPVPIFARVETPVVRPARRSRGPPQPLQAKSMNIPIETPATVSKEVSTSLAKWSAPRVWDPPKARVAQEPDAVGTSPVDVRPPSMAPAAGGRDIIGTSVADVCLPSKARGNLEEGKFKAGAPGKPSGGARTIRSRADVRVGPPDGQVMSQGLREIGARKEKPGITPVKGCLALSSGKISSTCRKENICSLFILIWRVRQ